jgi:hypothetical protein
MEHVASLVPARKEKKYKGMLVKYLSSSGPFFLKKNNNNKLFLFLLLLFFNYVEPHQSRALQTHPWRVNPGYTTPPTKTVYQVIQGNS